MEYRCMENDEFIRLGLLDDPCPGTADNAVERNGRFEFLCHRCAADWIHMVPDCQLEHLQSKLV